MLPADFQLVLSLPEIRSGVNSSGYLVTTAIFVLVLPSVAGCNIHKQGIFWGDLRFLPRHLATQGQELSWQTPSEVVANQHPARSLPFIPSTNRIC
jgi:hypothetical protein